MIQTVKGLVLRNVKYGESDKLVTVLTEVGKKFFKARGIRSITSKNAAGCGSFVYSEFVLDVKGDKCYLRKATPLYSVVRAGASLSALALASYFAELAEDTARDAETGKSVLHLLMNALYLVAKEDRPTDLVKAVFEMRLLAANGLMPSLESCSQCEKGSDGEETLFFRFLEGDLVCRDCLSSADANYIRVSPALIRLCRHSLESGEEKAYALKVPPSLLKEFSRLAEKFLLHQMERKYATLDFYREICGLAPMEAVSEEENKANNKEEKNETL